MGAERAPLPDSDEPAVPKTELTEVPEVSKMPRAEATPEEIAKVEEELARHNFMNNVALAYNYHSSEKDLGSAALYALKQAGLI